MLCSNHAFSQDEQENDSLQDIAETAFVDTLNAQGLSWYELTQNRLESIVSNSKLLKTTQVGLMVYDLTSDSLVYAYNEKQTLRPASTMKLLTAITSLDKLGGSYQFKTRLRYTGEVIDSTHTLKGDLYIVGGMDPRFDKEDMKAFISTIKEMHIDTIRGNICADRSMKHKDLLGEGWCWDDDNPVLSPLVYGRKDEMLDRFVDDLRREGIVFLGIKQEKVAPQSSRLICVRSHYIDQILMKMMKDSDNLYAECMFYQLAYAHSHPATAAGARSEIQSLIRKMNLAPSNYKIADGSGLSLYNYVSAQLEVEFLRYAYKNTMIYNHLYPSLPIAGVDGTLAKRMKGTNAASNVHAKTGTLTGISSLAGYARASNGHNLAFAIINQGVISTSMAKSFQDNVCVAITK